LPRYTAKSNRNKRARFDVGYGNELSPQRRLRIPVQARWIKGQTISDAIQRPVSPGDLRYYIVTLHCRRSTSLRARQRMMTREPPDKSEKLEIMIARGEDMRGERKKRRSFEKREIGLSRTNAPRSFRCGIRTEIRFPWEKSSPRTE